MEKRQQKLKEKEQQKKEKLRAQQQKTTTKLIKSKVTRYVNVGYDLL